MLTLEDIGDNKRCAKKGGRFRFWHPAPVLTACKAFYTMKELGLASCGVSVCVVVDWYGIG